MDQACPLMASLELSLKEAKIRRRALSLCLNFQKISSQKLRDKTFVARKDTFFHLILVETCVPQEVALPVSRSNRKIDAQACRVFEGEVLFSCTAAKLRNGRWTPQHKSALFTLRSYTCFGTKLSSRRMEAIVCQMPKITSTVVRHTRTTAR